MNPIHKVMLGAGGAAILALSLALIGLLLSTARLKTKLAEAQTYSVACRMANDDFSVKAARQNKAIEEIKAETIKHRENAQTEAKKAHETAQVFYAAADKLRRTKVKGDVCKAADELLNAYLRNNK